ncbi:MAG: hypothetical protein V2J55_04370 [Candidatus Competibacteraceae bacterium]|jgi:hypothetical protein|nr:hypothetical protein [Candidatus Competibacteraceae bacterium]
MISNDGLVVIKGYSAFERLGRGMAVVLTLLAITVILFLPEIT